ncbi:hypothetical protein AKO1_006090 [Acrasis kona]|uniref:Calcineurin-like phosphoesterase domain-containing protein n=1 Tax=Acrasis kona TaxID=1008807 RepID=A0AAW2YHW9_9EUKA
MRLALIVILLISALHICYSKEVFAVGDLHGDWKAAISTFDMMNVIEKGSNPPKLTLSENQTLVQTGDLLDRGRNGLQLLRLSMYWHKHHPDQFVQLLGNHELMNMQRIFEYVNDEELTPEYRSIFRNSSSSEMIYLENDTIITTIIDDVLYVHAGLLHEYAILGTEEINQQTKAALKSKNFRHSLLRSSGPLWTRKLAMKSCKALTKALKAVNAKHMVVGHTIQKDGVNIQCLDETGHAIILIDTGISFGNKGGIKIVDGRYLHVYSEKKGTVVHDLEAKKTFESVVDRVESAQNRDEL